MALPAFKALVAALLGISAYQKGDPVGPKIDDRMVERVREAMGGNLAPMPTTKLRWYLPDLEAAQHDADAGNLRAAAQLCRAMRRDGTMAGLMGTLSSGVVRLPKKFYGDSSTIGALKARNGSRSVFDDMCPPSELELLVEDGTKLGVAIAELVPVPGRDFPVLVRLEPEFLQYRWQENRWYYLSVAASLPITPGDGRWVLHTPGGRMAPWMSGLWAALARSYIGKEHALLHRANYVAKLANAARAATAPPGATEAQRAGFLSRVIAWGINTVFELPVGWDVKLIESNGRGWEVFQNDIDTHDREIAIAIAGQVVTVDGGAGFQNSDIHRAIRGDIVQNTADQLAYTLNTQVLPQYVATHFGIDALRTGAQIEYDTSRPKDLEAEARSMQTAGAAIDGLIATLAKVGKELDVESLLTRFGIPIKGDVDGDGVEDGDGDVSPEPGASPALVQ